MPYIYLIAPQSGQSTRIASGVRIALEEEAAISGTAMKLVVVNPSELADLEPRQESAVAAILLGGANTDELLRLRLPVIAPFNTTASDGEFAVTSNIETDMFAASHLVKEQGWSRPLFVSDDGDAWEEMEYAYGVAFGAAAVPGIAFARKFGPDGVTAASVASAKPDVVLVSAGARDFVSLVRQCRALGVQAIFIAMSEVQDAPELIDGTVDDVYYVGRYVPNDPDTKSFVAAFTKRYGAPPDHLAALGHDAGVLAAEDVVSLSGQVPVETKVPLAIGKIRFFERQVVPTSGLPILHVQGGRVSLVQRESVRPI